MPAPTPRPSSARDGDPSGARGIARGWGALLFVLASACGGEGTRLEGTVSVDACGPPAAAADCTPEPDPACRALFGAAVPEAGASVTLSQADAATVSAQDGSFAFVRLPDGAYALSASAPGTVERRLAVVVEVGIAAPSEPVAFVFVAAGDLEGRVLPPAAPPEGVDPSEVGGVDQVEVQLACPPRTAITDATGRFHFAAVPQGERLLSAVGLGLVGTSEPVLVSRGRHTDVEIPLAYGRPPNAPGNRPPTMDAPLTAIALAPPQGSVWMLRPPVEGWVRGDRIALTCQASDPDGDPLQYVWSASSGSLEAGSGDTAVLTTGESDAGVTCTVLDGRGGIVAVDLLITVSNSYFAGAALTPDGAWFAAAYGGDFELVRWRPEGAERLARAGPQWLPRASEDTVAYIDRSDHVDALWSASLAGAFAPQLIDLDVLGYAAVGDGVAWVDASGAAWVRDRFAQTHALGNDFGGDVAARADIVAFARTSELVELYALDDGVVTLVGSIPTPGRAFGRLATDGARVAYWAAGVPTLATASATTPLATDVIAQGDTGRIALTRERAAFSYYASPLEFIEATVVAVDGNSPGEPLRVGTGPSEVLDLRGDWLLLGRPRAEESEPSRDLWIVDLASDGSAP